MIFTIVVLEWNELRKLKFVICIEMSFALISGFPHNRENGKSPGIRYWSFKAMKSPGISTFGALSRELSGEICSFAHPQRHSYAWMLNLVYQLFYREKTSQL